MAQPHETSNPIVTVNNSINDLLGAPLGPDWTVESLAEQVLDVIAVKRPEETQEFVLDADCTMDRQARRLIRPLLACLASKSAAEAGTPANLYGGYLSFQRTGPEGPVWILGHFENRPGSVRATLRRSSLPPEAPETRRRLLHLRQPTHDPARPRLDWERLKDLCNEDSPSRCLLEELCVAVREQELAFLGSRGLRVERGYVSARSRVWRTVRSEAMTPARTQALFAAVRAALRAIVGEVESHPDPGSVIPTLWPPERIIQELAREELIAQTVEVMEALLVEANA